MKFYDRAGQPMTLEEWSSKLADLAYKRVAYTTVRDECVVSTVWLGLEHHFSFGTPEPDFPIHTFETMIFGGPLDQQQWRYGTEEDAHIGHEHAVKLARLETYLEITEAEEPTLTENNPPDGPVRP